MKIIRREYAKSLQASDLEDVLISFPEIAIVGRSNVGKSTFINDIVGAKVARSGKNPGVTKFANIFKVEVETEEARIICQLADLPGYGYAKAPAHVIEDMGMILSKYIVHRPNLVFAVLLLDIRREPSELDLRVRQAIFEAGVPLIVCCTKVDKISKSERNKRLEVLSSKLSLEKNDIFGWRRQDRAGGFWNVARGFLIG